MTAVKAKSLGLAAEQLNQFIVNNFNDLLAGRKAGQHLTANSLFSYRGNKIFDYGVVDISFKKGPAHFTHAVLNIFFRQLAMAAKFLENSFQAIRKIFKHNRELNHYLQGSSGSWNKKTPLTNTENHASRDTCIIGSAKKR